MDAQQLDTGVAVIGPLNEQAVRDAWPKVVGYLAEALDRDGGKMLPDDVLEQIAQGLMGLYTVVDFATGEILAALVCEAQEYARESVFNIAYCGGRDLYRWAGLLGEMEREAARLGCQTVRITGRPGWGRIFPDYREMNRIFERRVVV